MAEGAITVNGTRIAYSDEGSGPLVVRAHGLTHSRHTDHDLGLIDWRLLIEAGFRVVAYDARGHGDSGGTSDPDSYRWESLASDLLAVIDQLSPHEPVRAVGISMGTGTILTALTMSPDRFAAVALGAPPTAWDTRALQVAIYEELARAAESTSYDELVTTMSGAPVPPIFASVDGWPAAPAVHHRLLPAVMRGAGRSDLPGPDALAALDIPALILAWDTDPGHPVTTARRLTALLRRPTLHISETTADLARWPTRAADHFHTCSGSSTDSRQEER